MLDLKLDKAVELVEQAIASKPEGYAYKGPDGICMYVDYDETYNDSTEEYDRTDFRPGCLVGTAVILGGIEQDDLLQGTRNQKNCGDLLADLRYSGLLTYDQDAARYLELLQLSQDNGATWSEAHKRALKGQRGTRDHNSADVYWIDTESGNRVE